MGNYQCGFQIKTGPRRTRYTGAALILAASLTVTGCGSRESGTTAQEAASNSAGGGAAQGAPVAPAAGTNGSAAGSNAAGTSSTDTSSTGSAPSTGGGTAGTAAATDGGAKAGSTTTSAVRSGSATKSGTKAATGSADSTIGSGTGGGGAANTAPKAGAGAVGAKASGKTGGATTGQAAAAQASSGSKTTATPANGGFGPVVSASNPIDIQGADSQGVSAKSIKLGVIAPLSGAAGFLGEAEVAAIRAYTSLVNAQGGIKGRMYSTVITDSQFEPALEAQAARKLVDNDKVFALFSVLGDSTGPYVSAKGIPTMVFGLNPPAFSSKYPTTYVTGFSTMDSVVRMAYSLKILQKKPINNVAILYDTANIPIGPWVKYLSAAWKAVGADVKSTDAFNVSDGDCTSIVLKVQSLKIDFWQSAQSLNWPACAAAMGRQHWQPPLGFGGPYTSDNKFVTQGGSVGMNGVYGEQVGIQVVQSTGQPYTYGGQKPHDVAPLTQAYLDSIKKFAPNSADTDTLESIWTQTFWVAVQALTKAIDTQTSAITWKGVNQWFASQKNYQSGLTSPINFDPKCKTGSGVWLYQWKWNQAHNRFEQTPWNEYGGPFTMPDSYLNKIVPGAGQCYLTKAADNEL
jgi:ABC-type branched-subunit amino acid transport system substrate-binding protein